MKKVILIMVMAIGLVAGDFKGFNENTQYMCDNGYGDKEILVYKNKNDIKFCNILFDRYGKDYMNSYGNIHLSLNEKDGVISFRSEVYKCKKR